MKWPIQHGLAKVPARKQTRQQKKPRCMTKDGKNPLLVIKIPVNHGCCLRPLHVACGVSISRAVYCGSCFPHGLDDRNLLYFVVLFRILGSRAVILENQARSRLFPAKQRPGTGQRASQKTVPRKKNVFKCDNGTFGEK